MKSSAAGFNTGLLCASLAVIIWTAGSFFTKYLQAELHFKGIFLFTYIASSLFSLNILIWYFTSRNETSATTEDESDDGNIFDDSSTANIDNDQEYGLIAGIDRGRGKHDKSSPTSTTSTTSIDTVDTVYTVDNSIDTSAEVEVGVSVTSSSMYLSLPTSDTSPSTLGDVAILTISASFSCSEDSTDTCSIHENRSRLKEITKTSQEITNNYRQFDSHFVLFQWLMRPIPSNYNHKDLLHASLLLMPLWFIGTFFYSYSLLYTSLGNAIVMFNLNGTLTLLFSWFLGVETVTSSKLLGITLSFSGAVLISFSSNQGVSLLETQGSSVFGDMMALIGAIGYGLYTTFLKIKIPEALSETIGAAKVSISNLQFSGSKKDDKMNLLFGYFGVVACIGLFPVVIYFILFHKGSIGDLTPFIFGYIIVEEIFDGVIANYLYAKATILTTPTITAVSITMTVPCAIIADWFYEGIVPSTSQVIGALQVICGVCCFLPIICRSTTGLT